MGRGWFKMGVTVIFGGGWILGVVHVVDLFLHVLQGFENCF